MMLGCLPNKAAAASLHQLSTMTVQLSLRLMSKVLARLLHRESLVVFPQLMVPAVRRRLQPVVQLVVRILVAAWLWQSTSTATVLRVALLTLQYYRIHHPALVMMLPSLQSQPTLPRLQQYNPMTLLLQ